MLPDPLAAVQSRRTAAAAANRRRRSYCSAEEPLPVTPSPNQAHLEVDRSLLVLFPLFPLAAVDSRRRNPAVTARVFK